MFKTILCVLGMAILALVIYGGLTRGINYSVDKICNDYAKSYQTCITETK